MRKFVILAAASTLDLLTIAPDFAPNAEAARAVVVKEHRHRTTVVVHKG